MLCVVVLCDVRRCGRGVVVGRGVCVCVFVYVEKTRVWIQKTPPCVHVKKIIMTEEGRGVAGVDRIG